MGRALPRDQTGPSEWIEANVCLYDLSDLCVAAVNNSYEKKELTRLLKTVIMRLLLVYKISNGVKTKRLLKREECWPSPNHRIENDEPLQAKPNPLHTLQ